VAVTRIKNNQITDASAGNTQLGINANTKVQDYSVTSTKLANNLTYGSDLTISGNLSVTGTTTAVDTTYTNIQDPLIVLADGQTAGSPTVDIGYIGLRGNQANIASFWNEANSTFAVAYTNSGMTDNTVIAINSYADFKANNINTVTNISAGGNVSGVNLFATTDVSVGGNVQANSVLVLNNGTISTGGNVSGGNVLATTDVSAGANVNVTTNVSAGGNVYAANFATTGAQGNITGANVISAVTLTASGSVDTAGNVNANNVTVGNIVSATGNIVTSNFFVGDGYYISNINAGNVAATKIFNGGSYANIAATDGNLVVAVGAGSNVVATFYDTGVDINGNASVSGNVIAQANVSGGNVNATTDVSAGANVVGGNVLTNGVVSASSTITGGNVDAGTGFISTTGAVSGGNVYATTDVTAGGNVVSNNVNVTTNVSAGGNVYGANFATTGSGGNITGANVISSVTMTTTGSIYAGANVSANGNVIANNDVTAVGNVSGGNVNAVTAVSAGGNIAGGNLITAGYVTATGDVTGGNLITAGYVTATGNATVGNLATGGQVSASGNVTANVLVGSYANISYTANVGNVETQGYITATGNVQVGNLLTAGRVSATGDVFGGNVSAVANVNAANVNATIVYANVSASGNVLGANLVSNYLYSDGSPLTISAAGTNNGISLFANGTGNIAVGSTYINNLLDPVQNQDAATKFYVDSVAQGLAVKASVSVSTTSPLANVTNVTNVVYYNGPANDGVGATLTVTSSAQISLDGVDLSTLPANARVLIHNETGTGANDTNAAWNGIYYISTNSPTSTVFTRSLDMNAPSEFYGAFTFVQDGTQYAASGWVCTNTVAATPITIGTTAINWTQFSGAGAYSQGNGIAINGTVISTRINTGNLQYDGSGNLQVSSSAQFTTPNLGSATGSQISVTGFVNASTVGAVEISASGNVYGGNVSAVGTIVAVANIAGGNLLTGNIVSAGGNITGGNLITGGYLSVAANVFAGNLSLAGNVFSDINSLFNITTGGYITAVGNVSGGNVNATTDVSAGANVVGGNVLTGGLISAGGTITGGNVDAGTGYISTTGTVSGGNVIATTNVSAGGNVLANTDVSAGGNVLGGNVTATTNVSAGGNVLGGNVTATTNVSAGGNVLANTDVSAGGNVLGGNVTATTNVSAGGNVLANTDVSAGGNVLTSGNVSATANITGGNLLTGGLISATANIDGGNIVTAGNVTATGNISTANYFVGDGYYISNINAGNVATTKITNGDSYANVTTSNGNVTIGVNGNLVATFYDTGISSTGNINVDGLTIATGQSIVGTTTNANITLLANGNGTVEVYSSGGPTALAVDGVPNVQHQIQIYTTGAGLIAGNSMGGVFAGSYVIGNGAPTQSQNRLAALIGKGTLNGTVANIVGAKITLDANADWSAGSTPAHISLWTTSSGNAVAVESARVESNGDFSIFAGSLNAANGNVYTTSISASGSIVADANITGGNIYTGGLISSTGNVTSGTFFYVDPVDSTVLIGNSSIVACSVLSLNTTTSFVVPVGNTAQRPSSTYTGMVRFNTSQNNLEVYDNAQWSPVGSTTYTVIADEQFNGDGSTVAFTLGSTQTTNSCIVSINGVVQIPTLAYAVSGTYPTCVLTFTEAPELGDVIDVREITTTVTLTELASQSGNATVTVSNTSAEVDIKGNLVTTVNSTAPTLTTNKTLSFQLVSDTSLKILVRGSDGVTRSATLTLS
jgi:filamentous hemagglutinin